MIPDPKIAGVALLSFKSSDGGGNSWEYSNEGKYLRFVTYSAEKNILPQVKISKESENGGFRHLATIHFRNEGDDMRAVDVSFSDSQKYPLNGEDSFTVGKTCFSKEWNDHTPTFLESIVRTWNSERPFKEKVMYSAKEATVNCIQTVEKYSKKTSELD